jgi:hypothetical protein
MQIAADSMLRHLKTRRQIRTHHSAVFLQDLANQRLSLLGKSSIIEQSNSLNNHKRATVSMIVCPAVIVNVPARRFTMKIAHFACGPNSLTSGPLLGRVLCRQYQ